MNIWLALDPVENKKVDNIRSRIKAIEALNQKEYAFYFKILPTSIGCIL